jgi:hypothetical protein
MTAFFSAHVSFTPVEKLPVAGGSGKSSFDVSGLGIYFIRNGRFHLIVRYFVRFSVKR